MSSTTENEKKSFSSKISKSVLVAVDGSNPSIKAFDYALENTSSEDKVIIYHGHSTNSQFQAPLQVSEPNISSVMETLLNKCSKLNRQCEYIKRKVKGNPNIISKDICQVAKDYDVDTVYVGSRGLTPEQRFFLGSVSVGCLEYCDRNVLIVKERKS